MNLFKKYKYLPFFFNYKKDIHLDNFLDPKDYEYIHEKLKHTFKEINLIVEKKYFQHDYNYLENNFQYFDIRRVIMNLFLKLLVINKIYKKNKFESIEIDLFKEESNFYNKSCVNGFSLNRFSNLYGLLAIHIGGPFKINILNNSIFKSKVGYIPNKKSKTLILRIANLDLNIILNIIFRKLGLQSFNKKIFTFKSSSSTREILQELATKGIGDDNIEAKLKKIYFVNTHQENDQKLKKLHNEIMYILETNTTQLKNEFDIEENFFKGFLKIIADISSRNIQHLQNLKKELLKKIKELKEKNSDLYPICLSNGLFDSFGIACADALIENNIKIISTTHSLKGIHLNEKEDLNFNEAKTSHTIFCYNEASKSILAKNTNTRASMLVIGAPKEVKVIKYKKIQKLVNKQRLSANFPVVFYVSHNIELNVEKGFPCTKPNPDLFSDELKLIDLFGKVKKNIMYKPYPTKQYLEDKENYIKKKIEKFKNIQYINFEEDFRYLRTISDILITQSNQSTLGWCIGTNLPLVYLDSKYYNSLMDDNTRQAFQECFFFFNYDEYGWEKELINFLNKPYDEILQLWKKKEPYRKKYDDIYFLSSKKNAGKLGANYIEQLMSKK